MPLQYIVLDSAIFLASVQKERYREQSDRLLYSMKSSGIQIAAPVLLQYELTAVVRKNVYRKTLSSEDAIDIRRKLTELMSEILFLVDNRLLQRGYELAETLNLPTAYDSQYLAVAERLGCDFWTADERLYNSVKQELTWVRWIGQLA